MYAVPHARGVQSSRCGRVMEGGKTDKKWSVKKIVRNDDSFRQRGFTDILKSPPQGSWIWRCRTLAGDVVDASL